MQVDKSTANVLGTNKQKNMYTYIFSLGFPSCFGLCKQKIYYNMVIS